MSTTTTVDLTKTDLQKQAKNAKKAAKRERKLLKATDEDFVAMHGYGFSSGRVYVTGPILEGAAAVLRSGGRRIVQTSGVGRHKAVLIQRRESGDVSIQNLGEPRA